MVKKNNLWLKGLQLLFALFFPIVLNLCKTQGNAGSQSQVSWQTQVFPSPCLCAKEVFWQLEGTSEQKKSTLQFMRVQSKDSVVIF